MILFKPENIAPILNRTKTVTRRRWKRPRAKVGSIHQARTQLFGKPFARLRIISVRRERYPGESISPLYIALRREALKEGFVSWDRFGDAWETMHGSHAMIRPCYRVEFEII